MKEDLLFRNIKELEEAYTAGVITPAMYLNEYNKFVNVKIISNEEHDDNKQRRSQEEISSKTEG